MITPENLQTIITHSGPFHADDVFAVALLKSQYPNARVIRTRDSGTLKTGIADPHTVLVDVGGFYSPDDLVFDHHHRNAPLREDGLPFASYGLVLRAMGVDYDTPLVRHIDANDNGIDTSSDKWSNLRPPAPWREFLAATHCRSVNQLIASCNGGDFDHRFDLLVTSLAQTVVPWQAILSWVGESRLEFEESKQRVEQALLHHNGTHIIVFREFEKAITPVLSALPEDSPVRFAVWPDTNNRDWVVRAVPRTASSREVRLTLPKSWAGLSGKALQEITRVGDAVFCHTGLHLAKAGSYTGATELADLALAQL